ncbi:MAG: hypothetical protein H0T45_19565 [Pyrinomonadaceae bacterium]|nr:hypothetical protein [Pyrinomonadaceae bacterium]
MPINDDEDNADDKAQSGETDLDDAETLVWESGKCPPEARAQFRQSVAAYEQAPWTTRFQLLEEAGIHLPSPESMNDRQLEAKLWEMIEGLAGQRVFLSQTDHLNDRALYNLFWHDLLREAAKDLSLDDSSAWHIDLLGSGSEEDTYLYLKYYADDAARRQWSADFPDDEMPEHEEPPFDRDRRLPQADDRGQTNVEDDQVM